MKAIRTWKQLLQDPRVESIHWENNYGETSRGKISNRDVWINLKKGWLTHDGTSSVHEWSKRDAIRAFNFIVAR